MSGLTHTQVTEYERIATGMAARDYFGLSEDHPRCELIRGELWIAPSPSFWHQDCAGAIYAALSTYAKQRNLGKAMIAPLDIQLFDDTVVQPDVLVLAPDYPQVLARTGIITVPPMLAVEVLSPSSVAHDRSRKFELYEAAGLRNYWIADVRAKSVEAWTLVSGRYKLAAEATAPKVFAGPPFPECKLDLREIFGEPSSSAGVRLLPCS